MTRKNKPFLSDALLFYMHAGLFAFSEIIFLFSLPILFWNKEFSLSFIFAFYALAALPGYFLTARIVHYITKIGIKSIFLLGIFLYILLGVVVPFIEVDNMWWVVAFFLLALQALCYFPARYLCFSEIISRKTIGMQAGTLNAVMLLSRTVAPIVAGALAVWTQFNNVFIFGVVMMGLSMIPVLLIRTQVQTHFDPVAFKTMSKHSIFKSTRWAYVADGMNSLIAFLLWPLLFFLFISQEDYFQLSFLMTITCGVSAIIMVGVGKLFDQQHRKTLLRTSVFANVLAILGRFSLLFFHPILFVYAMQSFYSFSESMLQPTFESYWYSYSKTTNTMFFTIHREVNYALGRFLIGTILAVASAFFMDEKGLWPLFLLSIPMVLIYLKKGQEDALLNV
ncbi:MAG: MFS transporter [Candidatus Gracilibacteria bacterium]